MTDAEGQTYGYRQLIWAADLKTIYQQMDPDAIPDGAIQQAVHERRDAVADKSGGDSVFTLYLALDLDKSYFSDPCQRAFLLYTAQAGAILGWTYFHRRIPR